MQSDILTQSEAIARTKLVSNVDYKVSLELSEDPAAKTYRSTTRLSFDCATASASTFLNLVADSVDSIRINGQAVDKSAFSNNRIALQNLRSGHNEVELVANASYMQNGVGLHRKVDPADNRTYLYTHFEPFDAHRVYACFDQPDIKAAFTLDVTAPTQWVVASNQGWYDPAGSTTAVQTNAVNSGMTHTQFGTTPQLPPYLTHLSAGPYVVRTEQHKSIPLFLMARESQKDVLDRYAAWMFDITKEGLDLFRDAFGFDYQFAHYGQIFVPEFNAGAMENPGCVTFNDYQIPVGRASHSQMTRLAKVILHEMAHVYGFGDVTTMTWWDDLHLNETFATFMEYLILSRTKEFANDAWVEFAQVEKSLALEQDQLPTTHPVKANVTTTEEVSQLFDMITYAKGASVIRQLYALLGDKDFFAGLQKYFADHWFGNATQSEFLGALGHAAGRDLQGWGHDWMGTAWVNTIKPKLRIDRSGNIVALSIEQNAPAKYPTLRTHRIAVGLYDLDANGKLVRRASIEGDISGSETKISDTNAIGKPRPDLILVNDRDLTYAKVRFDATSLQTLRDHIGDIEDPLARTVAWTAVWDMTRDAELPARHYVDMVTRHASAEGDVTILERLLLQATSAANLYCDASHRAAARTQLATLARQRSDGAAAGSELQLVWLRSYFDTAQTQEQLDDLRALLDGKRQLAGLDVPNDADLRWAIVIRLAAMGGADGALINAEAKRDPSDTSERRKAAALAARPTASAKQESWQEVTGNRTLPLATLRAICGGEVVGGRRLGGFHQPGQDTVLAPYVKAYLTEVPKFWAQREENEAEDITEMLYPRFSISQNTVADTTKLLRRKLPYGADRMLREARDRVQRAMRARHVDLSTKTQKGGPPDGVSA